MAPSNDTQTTLLETYRHSGQPLATIYIPTPSASEDAQERLRLHTKNAVSDLEALGASTELVTHASTALDALDHAAGLAHVLVVGESGVLLSQEMIRPITHRFVHVGQCPALLPIIEATQTDVTHLAVIVDRTGADVLVRHGVGAPVDAAEVEGPDVRVHRSHPGGWSQKRFQQTAENAWENNAREVVDQIVDDHPDVELVVCGGDVRALGFFVQHLPKNYEVYQVDGSRHADVDAFLDEADTALRTRSAATLVDLLDEMRTAMANGDASTGHDTLEHLGQARVDHLIVANNTSDNPRETSYFDFSVPRQTADDETMSQAPCTDAAVAMAIASGAQVTVVPSHTDVDHGVSALLRF